MNEDAIRAAALRDALADLAQTWTTRRREHEIRRETSDGATLAAHLAADIYSTVLAELAAAVAGHGPAQTTSEQLAAVEARAQRNAEIAADHIRYLEQQITALAERSSTP